MSVSVNGTERKWFLLDTGANSCVFDHRVAESLGLVPQFSGEGTGAGAGPVAYRRYVRECALFEAGGVQFRCDHLISLDLSQQPAVLGRAVDGILGSDFISQYVVELDYDSAVLRLHDPAGFRYTGRGEAIPLTFDRRLPYVTARLTVTGVPPEDRRLLVDSGSEDAVDDEIILKSTGPRRETTGGVGLGETYRAVFGWVERFDLGRFNLTHLPSVAPGVALIGGEVLRRFRVILDYSRQRLILEPGAHFSDSYRGDRSGLELRLATGGEALIVQEVHKGSPAATAGLQVGDRILAVDGTTVATLGGLRRVQRLLTVASTGYRLRVERLTKIQEVELLIGSGE